MARKIKKYRLQIVLEQREEAKERAVRYLAERRAILKREQEEEDRLREELKRNRDRQRLEYEKITHDGLTSGLDVNMVQNRLNYIKYLDAKAESLQIEIDEQILRVKKAEKDVEEALQELIQASRELQVLEKHKEKWQKKMKRQEDIEQENEMNEIGNVMYGSNQLTSSRTK